ncbi:MAG: CDP-alcohol phosphatidyltransferase family protein [Ruminococcus sp.]
MDNDNKMIIAHKSDLWTVPNLLTYLRFVLVVPFVILFLSEKYLLSAICIGLSGISDCLDGFFARKLNQVTQLGKLLDPIADKVTLISVMLCMAFYAPNVIPILVVLIAKDVAMLIGGISLLKRKITPPAAEWFGKLATIVFYFAVCIIVFMKAAINYENLLLDDILLSVTAVAMLYALYRYAKIYRELIKEDKAKKQNKSKQ